MKNENDKRSQQPDSKSNQEARLNNSDPPQDKPNMNVEDAEEGAEKTTFQRRPQFRFDENYKRRKF